MRSIGAGGGSIAWIDDGGLMRVGPQSAGADPGPACYGRGGVLPTVAKAHQADIGNSLPTTYMAQAKDQYEEGALIFPAVRVQHDFKMNEDVVRMCRSRIRVPSQWYGDFLAGIGSARIAERRLKELCTKYGKETISPSSETGWTIPSNG
jgi:N-methylhydantoinase B/oxoprolinase/acetone carboxylase alpha subunit